MERQRLKRLRNRKGFALILVFSLASIILLLALSLVSLTQVESASSRYDQGLRVARANARLALKMALGDLQELAGPDQRITATADGARTDGSDAVGDSFNDVTDPTTNGVYQPFWTGVWNNDNGTDNPVWLVTRPLDATYSLTGGVQDANPFASDLGTTNDLVKLVGEGSAEPEPGDDQSGYDIYVPKEAVASANIVGLDASEEATIGHYAYWVGDNGVKASYLLEDFVQEVAHDDYGPLFDHDGDELTPDTSFEQLRLKQMATHLYHLEVDGTLVDVDDARLAAITSEFALRDEEESGISILGLGSGSFTKNDVRRRFHDFSGLSRGLLADTVRGGLREDLSFIHEVDTGATVDDDLVDSLVNEYLMTYLNVGSLGPTSPTDLKRSYSIAAKITSDLETLRPTVAPVLTGMKLAVRVIAPELALSTETSAIKGQLEFSARLWNPYSSAIETMTPLVFKLKNPHSASGTEGFVATYLRSGVEFSVSSLVGFSELIADVTEFEITAGGSGEQWGPGETRSFIGVLDPFDATNPGRVILTESSASPDEDDTKFYPINGLPPYVSQAASPSDRGDSADRMFFGIPSWTPEIDLEIDGTVVCEYRLDADAYEFMEASPDLPVTETVSPNIAYVWELGDPRDLANKWLGFDPRSGELSSTVLSPNFNTDYKFAGDVDSVEYVVKGSAIDLLGYNDVASPEITHNIPLFELPRQEFLSLGALHMVEFPSGLRSHLGMSSADSGVVGSINDVFDRFFLSTVPQLEPTDWEFGDPLPNGRMEILAGSSLSDDLRKSDSAEHLYLKGAFNVNSTSVEAWTSLLKGIRLESWEYDDGVVGITSLESEQLLDNQFLRFSQSAEETWQGTYASDADGLTRERFRKGLNSYTDAQMKLFASKIVEGIRTRRQASSGSVGPFVSLQDFIDSGVIQLAISEASLNGANIESYTSSYLTQQDVLTAIAPYLSARSDTFVVRAYGDAVNPFDDEEILARAYCEAIVQRTHAKHSTDPSSADIMAPTGTDSGEFGRQFKVIAFRWMTGDEL